MNAPHRTIQSFVRRNGRISDRQIKAYQTYFSIYGIPYAAELLDLEEIFERSAPKILEIGFGMGQTTAKMAEDSLEYDFLGVEVHTPGVGNLIHLVNEKKLSNIRIIQYDAVAVVQHMIPIESLFGIHIFFPDPWPKKRHHKRRLIQAHFLHILAHRLQKGGYLHLATDWENYAHQMQACLSQETLLSNSMKTYTMEPLTRPLTKFEKRGQQLGHTIFDFLFYKK